MIKKRRARREGRPPLEIIREALDCKLCQATMPGHAVKLLRELASTLKASLP